MIPTLVLAGLMISSSLAGAALYTAEPTRYRLFRETGVKDTYIVTFKQNITDSEIAAHISKIRRHHAKRNLLSDPEKTKRGLTTESEYNIGSFRGYSLECDRETLRTIRESKEVASIEQDRVFAISGLSVSTIQAPAVQSGSKRRKSGWALHRLSHKSPPGPNHERYRYKTSWAGAGSTIYILDSGCRTTHSEFEGRVSCGRDYLDPKGNCDDRNGRGTVMTSLAVGKTVGVARKAKAVCVKIANNFGMSNSLLIAGIHWVINNHPAGNRHRAVIVIGDVRNTSEWDLENGAVNEAVEAAVQAGFLIVVAAGDDDMGGNFGSPASATNTITVGAIDRHDQMAARTNYGPRVDIWAPGSGVIGAGWSSDKHLVTVDGTAAAAGLVAGLAAYFQSSYNDTAQAGPAVIKDRIFTESIKGKVKGNPAGSELNNRIANNGWRL